MSVLNVGLFVYSKLLLFLKLCAKTSIVAQIFGANCITTKLVV